MTQKTQYDSKFMLDLHKKIEDYTSSPKCVDLLLADLNLFYNIAYAVYQIEAFYIKEWEKIKSDFYPSYFFNSLPIIKELEIERFKAFKAVYNL